MCRQFSEQDTHKTEGTSLSNVAIKTGILARNSVRLPSSFHQSFDLAHHLLLQQTLLFNIEMANVLRAGKIPIFEPALKARTGFEGNPQP